MTMDYHSYSPEFHIEAIQQILSNSKKYKNKISNDLSRAPELTKGNYGEEFYNSVFVDASFSHITATSLATFFESLFLHEFNNLKNEYNISNPLNNSPRWMLDEQNFWNPQKIAKEDGKLHNKANFVEGVRQLFDALEIPFLIPEINWRKIKILFHYRNYIAHNGFEWPKVKINVFENLIKNLDGEKYFSRATSGGKTWVLYLTEDFSNDLIQLAITCTSEFDNWFWKRSDEYQKKSAENWQFLLGVINKND
jgi:hypothetical protein